ncbi:MAG: nucleotidyltransferase domain-containing protein [Candidatus Bathyarchaeota archaeon]|nr:MAG: nucleotidyltransferase domain-containing protein [Candidatus Bathyarchaeota archaeon]
MPSNYEVALELDNLADQIEGEERKKRLLRMREHSLALMKALKDFSPVLRGSVWRGTARKGSDIDIDVYSDTPEKVEARLNSAGFEIEGSEEFVAGRKNQLRRSRHVYIRLGDAGCQAEVVIRSSGERGATERCEIYGDEKRGLNLGELEKLMKTDPLRKFVPKRRYK